MKRKKLIELRGSKTQEEVARSIGTTQKHLSKIELGERNPSLILLAKIKKYYGEELEVLFPDIFLEKYTPKRRKMKEA